MLDRKTRIECERKMFDDHITFDVHEFSWRSREWKAIKIKIFNFIKDKVVWNLIGKSKLFHKFSFEVVVYGNKL